MNDFNHGSVKVSNHIIDQVIAESALRVEGVKYVIGYKNQKLDYKKKDSIVSVINGNEVEIALTLVLDAKSKIYEVCEEVQETIKDQVKVMLNLDVNKVNVIVRDVI